MNQQVALGFLRHLGQDVVVANDGNEAVAAVAGHQFDLILMDMQMPNMDGIEATRRIRAMGGQLASVPIVAMTANASDEDRRLCIDAGMSAFQSKPITVARLAAILEGLGPLPPAASPVQTTPAGLNQRQTEIIEVLGQDTFG